MLTLHQFQPAFGLPNASPFCLKLECFLRIARIPYRTAPLQNPGSGPKGKGPFIELDGVRMGDTALIIRHLTGRFHVDLDAGLTPAERAVAHAMGVMLEEHLYFAMLHFRWIDDDGWAQVKEAFLGGLPAEAQNAVRAYTRNRLLGHGMGLHDPWEIAALGIADIEALAAQLGDAPYMMGDEPVLLDCIAFAFTTGLLCPVFDNPLTRAAAGHDNLVRYNQRMLRDWFPAFAPAAAA